MFPKLKVIVDFILSKISKDKKNLVSYTNLKKKKQVATVNNRRNRILKIMEKWSNRHVIDESFVLADRDVSGAPFQ